MALTNELLEHVARTLHSVFPCEAPTAVEIEEVYDALQDEGSFEDIMAGYERVRGKRIPVETLAYLHHKIFGQNNNFL